MPKHIPRCRKCGIVMRHDIMIHLSTKVHYCPACWEKKRERGARKWVGITYYSQRILSH